MKPINLFFAIVTSSLVIIACNNKEKEDDDSKTAVTAFDMQKARAFIDSINAKWVEELKNGDSVTIASHYGPGAKILLSNGEPISGNAILSMWGSMVRAGMTDVKFVTTELEGDSDYLIETGAYEFNDANTKKLVDKGNYVVTWKKQPNGEWKLYRDVGVTSMPAAR